ncbi:MAG: RDD family protein [Gammaproteobacteria bacterium]|nr:RDD family protein [Gammaproteobacteria bacterium]
MTVDNGSDATAPALMIDRMVARGLDLLMKGVLFLVTFVPFGLVTVADTLQDMMVPGRSHSPRSLILVTVVAAMPALAWEPVRQSVTGCTWGRAVTGIRLRDCADREMFASVGQVLLRYAASIVACGASAGLSFAAALVAGIGLTPWRVIGLTVIPSGLVWLSALLSALLRADRRGWHDVVAGTVLVSTVVPPARLGLSCNPPGGIVDGSVSGGEEL